MLQNCLSAPTASLDPLLHWISFALAEDFSLYIFLSNFKAWEILKKNYLLILSCNSFCSWLLWHFLVWKIELLWRLHLYNFVIMLLSSLSKFHLKHNSVSVPWRPNNFAAFYHMSLATRRFCLLVLPIFVYLIRYKQWSLFYDNPFFARNLILYSYVSLMCNICLHRVDTDNEQQNCVGKYPELPTGERAKVVVCLEDGHFISLTFRKWDISISFQKTQL